ncbi:MAG TPA: hypothetical protein VK151_02270 [Fluviicola sp.]|nr:hypothetical protein [Fluviicola sp.]
MKKQILYRIIFGFCVLCLLVWFILYNTYWGKKERYNSILTNYSQHQFADLVDSVGYDYSDHNSPKLYLRDGQNIDLSFVLNKAEIMSKCLPGDSVIKKENSLIITIIRSDSISENIQLKFAKAR